MAGASALVLVLELGWDGSLLSGGPDASSSRGVAGLMKYGALSPAGMVDGRKKAAVSWVYWYLVRGAEE